MAIGGTLLLYAVHHHLTRLKRVFLLSMVIRLIVVTGTMSKVVPERPDTPCGMAWSGPGAADNGILQTPSHTAEALSDSDDLVLDDTLKDLPELPDQEVSQVNISDGLRGMRDDTHRLSTGAAAQTQSKRTMQRAVKVGSMRAALYVVHLCI
jgi:hypothetical protein